MRAPTLLPPTAIERGLHLQWSASPGKGDHEGVPRNAAGFDQARPRPQPIISLCVALGSRRSRGGTEPRGPVGPDVYEEVRWPLCM